MRKIAAKSNLIDMLLIIVPLGVVLLGAGYYWFELREQPEPSETQTPVVDNRPLEVEVVKPIRATYNPETEFTVIANKEITFAPHSRIETKMVGELNDNKYYVVKAINIPTAGARITLNISDEVGNEFTQVLEIEREALAFPVGFSAITPWPDSEYILDGNDLTSIISRENRLLEDYEPAELVDLNKEFGLYTLNNAQLRADAGVALNNMITDMRRELGNSDITVVSGYRSYQTQLQTYVGHVRNLGEVRANEISARPGHSEHQLGTTVDFAKPSQNYSLAAFGESKEAEWLEQFAGEYGFAQFNDPDFAKEPWQYRYIGSQEMSEEEI